ncbi:DNA polymerase III subunit alpha [Microtetraspora fusca]|uniref:DNA polymerase III subunit alpha n=1 Tax=Microtetraspora fusca TaxID=1997 RepID=A0ABW6VE17_MICFU
MTTDSFVHLHVHTEYSMLDGAAKIKPLFAEAERLGMPAIGMTDHGNMFGAYEFHSVAAKTGVKPIIGIEAYVAPESRRHKKPVFWGTPGQRSTDEETGQGGDVSGNGSYLHMTLLAENATGVRNLFRMSSLASTEGYYYKPRMDRELLAEYSAGIIATTGCPGGEVQTRLRLGQPREALKAAAELRDIFGPDHLFVEVMDHGLPVERSVRQGLLDIARRLDLRTLATNDTHYVTEDDADTHDNLLCIGVRKPKSDPDRFRFNGSGYHIKSPAEMRAMFDTEVPGACDSTLLIAERVQSYDEVFAHRDLMPSFPVPEGYTQASWLREETMRGLRARFGDDPPQEVLERVDYELGVIEQMGFPAYFLVVADICAYARANGIAVGPGRGSATGSMVAYALRITELDPIEHGLIFERFLNPERVTMPDVDLDFDERRRGDVIRYVTGKYGADRCAQILTFGTIKAKAAIKDSCRVLDYPYSLGDTITKAFPPPVMGEEIPLTAIFDSEHRRHGEAGELRTLYEGNPDVRHIIDTARGLEGLTRGTGVHPAGVILSAQPLIDILPIHRRDSDDAIITGFPYGQAEAMGLLKMDFLGLRNLTVISDAVAHIKAKGVDLDLGTLPLDDAATYQLLARGETSGVFQLDGAGMSSLLKLIVPTRFEDIAAALALYRPGPMAANTHINYALRKNGQQEITPIHPELDNALAPILGTTYGLVVYQEQVMAIAQQLAGYTLGGADLLRRAMGKKKKEILDAEWDRFSAGMRERGYSVEATQALWDVLVPFSGYGFNKSHTAGYGVVSYWTAYLKANHPAEYMASLLASVGDDKSKAAAYLAECRRMGVQVLPPDVNASGLHCTPTGPREVRFGLGEVRNVGEERVASIIATRKSKGAYTSFSDFLAKSDLPVCNKRLLESLIKAGAFDSLGHSRRGLALVHEYGVDVYGPIKKRQEHGQGSLFGDDGTDKLVAINVPEGEWDKKTRLTFEREMLGLYVSDHPLTGAEAILERNQDVSIPDLLASGRTGGNAQICGLITNVEKKISSKQNKPWALVTVEDATGATIECLFFSRVYPLYAPELQEDAVVSISGRVNNRDGAISIFAEDLAIIDVSAADPGRPVVIAIAEERVNRAFIDDLRLILDSHRGDTPVHIELRRPGGRVTVLELPKYPIQTSPAFSAEIKALLGPEALRAS